MSLSVLITLFQCLFVCLCPFVLRLRFMDSRTTGVRLRVRWKIKREIELRLSKPMLLQSENEGKKMLRTNGFPDLCDALVQEFVGRVGAIVAPHLRACIASVIAGRHRFHIWMFNWMDGFQLSILTPHNPPPQSRTMHSSLPNLGKTRPTISSLIQH